MANFFNSFLSQIATGDTIKDYRHAERLYRDGVYRLSPKTQTLFHVFFEVNTDIANVSREALIETGMLAKTVSLPKYSIQTKTLNAYNRKNINQERINYDPVTITFHDDSADVVRQFWYSYYNYYFRDSDHSLSVYQEEHKYIKRQEQSWGFSPGNEKTLNFISRIRIYSLSQKTFSSYILINPTITSFQHGQHTSGEYGPLEHSMTVTYETVQYETGPVNENTVLGFADIHYDNSPSPLTSIGGGTRSVLGPGGLIEGAGDFVNNLQNGNFIGAALGGIRTVNNAANTNFSQAVLAETGQIFRDVLRGQNPTGAARAIIPTASSVINGLSRSISGIPSLNNILPNSNQGRIE